ncbi:MAG: hypothetical protein ACC628_17720, partial [Pirellulaceae bacterium]
DGNYKLTIDATKVRDAANNQLDGDGNGTGGDDAVDEFFRLYGDATGDGVVGIPDFILFRKSFVEQTLIDIFDFNGDGVVGIPDFIQFRARFGTRI